MSFNPGHNYIIVNYHYVEEPAPKFPGIHPCSIADFEKQIKFLSQGYQIVNVPQVFEAARSGRAGRFCSITFDDGLKDQYQNALPILQRHNVVASFFIITSALEGRLPTAHRVHILLSRFSVDELVNIFHDYLREFYPDLRRQYLIPKDRRLTDRRQHEDIATANLKETLILLPEDIKAQFLRFCFKKLGLNAEKISQSLFMNEKHLRELGKLGMNIGSHTHNHYALDTLNEEALAKDVRLTNEILSAILGESPSVFSYPHGRIQSAVTRILKEEGFRYGVTIERRGIEVHDDRFLIPRYDTADVRDWLTPANNLSGEAKNQKW